MTMKAIDRFKKHRDDGLRKIEVAELAGDDGKPFVIYATPLSLHERDAIEKECEGKSDREYVPRTLIKKCMDAKGEPLFTLEDKTDLMRQCDSDFLTDLVRWIAGGPDPFNKAEVADAMEETEKNSETIPSD